MQRFARYAVVGAVATAAHYAVLVACVRGVGWPAFIGSGLGAAVGAQVAFFGNRRFTFGHAGRLGPAWRRFQATALVGALAGMAIVAAGVALGLHYLIAQVVATGVGLVLTFVVNRAWTSRRVSVHRSVRRPARRSRKAEHGVSDHPPPTLAEGPARPGRGRRWPPPDRR